MISISKFRAWRRIVAAVLFAFAFTLVPLQHSSAKPAMTGAKMRAGAFHDAMRKLWEDHITWTRLYIVDFASSTPDITATTTRLLANQTDIGNAVKPFYGDSAGNQLTNLLKQHILGAVAILKAAKAGNKTAENAAVAAWFVNADQIAAFLNKANPSNWPLAAVKTQMHEHLNMTIQEATAQLTGNYAASVAAYDGVHMQILQLADILSSGIIKQFPSRFTAVGM